MFFNRLLQCISLGGVFLNTNVLIATEVFEINICIIHDDKRNEGQYYHLQKKRLKKKAT